MLVKKSRYRNSRYFTPDENGDRVFEGLRARDISEARGVIEHEVQAGDRLDMLARTYYNDDRLWWRIIDANPDIVFAQYVMGEEHAGKVILIPTML